VKALGIVIYHLGPSLRDTSLVLDHFTPRSHEAVRQWYERARVLFETRVERRRAIAIDETKINVQGKWMYVWAAIDIDTWEVLCTWVSQGRSGLEAISFLRKVKSLCRNRPMFYVDKAGWYKWALNRLGLPWEHSTFGPRNPIEQWFGILKQRIKRFYKRWPHNVDIDRVNEWIQSYVTCYHLKRGWGSLS
jgi:putative transposase